MSKRKTPRPPPAVFARVKSRPLFDVGVFTRAKAAPPVSVQAGYQTAPGDWSAAFGARGATVLGPPPVLSHETRERLAQLNVYDELLRMDVDPSVADTLASIDPQGSYVVIAVVYGGSGVAGSAKPGVAGVDREHTIVLVGRGSRLWGRFLHLCDPDGGGSELVSVDVRELASPVVNRDDAYPLWSDETVRTADGGVVEGTGQRAFWEMTRAKGGRPASRKGAGKNKVERKRDRKNKRARAGRKATTSARAKALEDAGQVGAANRLRKRSEKRRK